MLKITLKDGSVIEVAKDTPVTEIVSKISEGLARVALIAKFNGELIDLSRKLEEDGLKMTRAKMLTGILPHTFWLKQLKIFILTQNLR